MDDGKRDVVSIEVDASPLRATKGRVWGGISSHGIYTGRGRWMTESASLRELEVGLSPLRANKGGGLGGDDARNAGRQARGRRIL